MSDFITRPVTDILPVKTPDDRLKADWWEWHYQGQTALAGQRCREAADQLIIDARRAADCGLARTTRRWRKQANRLYHAADRLDAKARTAEERTGSTS